MIGIDLANTSKCRRQRNVPPLSGSHNLRLAGPSSFPRQQTRDFLHRTLRAIGVRRALALFGLIIGMAVHCYFERMSLPDAYVNAAMTLSGMGPLGELKLLPASSSQAL